MTMPMAVVERNLLSTESSPFDFSQAIRKLCEDICERLPDFAHIHMDHIAVTFAQVRRRVPYGLQAKLTPLRFEGGQLITRRRGRMWTIQRWYEGDVEILYILTFYLPRFMEQSFNEKMITIMHELYHINPLFNGDIRRLPGHCYAHSRSQAEYDRQMKLKVDQYLALDPVPDLYEFLKSNFHDLRTRFDGIVAIRTPVPKLFPVSNL